MRTRSLTSHQSHCASREDNFNMFAKIFIISALVAVTLAREYPAGVHPAVCPNYPYCDVDALARHTPDGMPIPQWGYNAAYSAPAPALLPAGVPAAPQYPAGLNPALCPNYPYCW